MPQRMRMCRTGLLKYKTLFVAQRHKSHKASLAALIRLACKLASQTEGQRRQGKGRGAAGQLDMLATVVELS